MIRSFIIALLLCITILLFNTRIGSLPPIGMFFQPQIGFWGNAENLKGIKNLKLKIPGLISEVLVYYDDNHVPHIYAKNLYDMYMTQGYITAKDRLWQMEFQTHAAAGRISEIIGVKAIDFDITQRRIGMIYGARQTLEVYRNDSLMNSIVESYTAGVNAYIDHLKAKDLPVEYKLLNYKPEPWTALKCALILKMMANDLTGSVDDIEATKTLEKIGESDFSKLFPAFPDSIDPIIPDYYKQSNEIRRQASFIIPQHEDQKNKIHNYSHHTQNDKYTKTIATGKTSFEWLDNPTPLNGSNNWAVAPRKTKDSIAILCNDPHLMLRLPSIWYQIHLQSPLYNAYGVSIPGAPAIIIGFNNHIAWGLTNGSRDVKDWYKVKFKDYKREEYWLDNAWVKTSKVIEEFKIRGEKPKYDTIIYTNWGPVFYDGTLKDEPATNLAMQWMGHRPGKELMTFYLLNKSRNYQEYKEAISYFDCPSQNFVFAATNGDIAITHQGKFPKLNPEQSRTIQDGSLSSNGWTDFIPITDNPQSYNPERGFVSSANQHPTDANYPYTYYGEFEYYRNRRINSILNQNDSLTVIDMQKLQNDNYNLFAAELLPYLLTHINKNKLDVDANVILEILAQWDFNNNINSAAASYFEVISTHIYNKLWDEFQYKFLLSPNKYVSNQYIRYMPDSAKYFDIINTKDRIETKDQILLSSFQDAVNEIRIWKNQNSDEMSWARYKKTSIQHLTRLMPFSFTNIPIGGNESIVNACTSTHGPSWRMIVKLKKDSVSALGILPGGQSGNPGSAYYDNMIADWAAGKYNNLIFYKDNPTPDQKSSFVQNITLLP